MSTMIGTSLNCRRSWSYVRLSASWVVLLVVFDMAYVGVRGKLGNTGDWIMAFLCWVSDDVGGMENVKGDDFVAAAGALALGCCSPSVPGDVTDAAPFIILLRRKSVLLSPAARDVFVSRSEPPRPDIVNQRGGLNAACTGCGKKSSPLKFFTVFSATVWNFNVKLNSFIQWNILHLTAKQN